MSATAPVRWFVPQLNTLPIAARRCVVRSALDGASLELSFGEHAVLASCSGCGTLAEHEARAAAQLGAPAEHRPAIRALLERCVRQGLLVPVEQLAARFGAPQGRASRGVAAAVIRTCDRPRLLARLLASAAALEERSGARRRWIVIDDSRDAASERANRAAIAAARPLDVAHYDRAAGEALQGALVAEFPRAAREIAWLLAPGGPGEATYGRALNHALLHLAGRAFLTLDDDVLLEPRRPALADAGFAVSDAADELTWYQSEEALLRRCPAADLDPIEQHARWLGLPMAEAWLRAEEESGALAAMEISPAQASRFAPDARILFTHSHACGDPGSTVLPLHLLALPARSRAWLAANPDAVAHAFGQRINWRGQTRLRFAPGMAPTLTTLAGLDNSSLLPPTARAHRSEDLLLGVVAQWIHRSAWHVELPFGVPHRREPAKRWLRAGDPVAPEPLPFVFDHLERHRGASAAAGPEQRLAAAAALLADLAAASDGELGELLLGHAREDAARVRFAIQEQLDDAALPGAWKALLAPWLDSPALALDGEALRARTPGAAAMRSLVDAYARALRVWPRLWRFCQERAR